MRQMGKKSKTDPNSPPNEQSLTDRSKALQEEEVLTVGSKKSVIEEQIELLSKQRSVQNMSAEEIEERKEAMIQNINSLKAQLE